jgi:integrase
MATKFFRPERGTWHLQYSENGVQKRPSIGKVTKAEAEAARVALERRLESNRPSAGPLFSDWSEEYAIWHREEWPDSYFRVAQIIEQHLAPTFGALPLMAISKKVVDAFKHSRIKTINPRTGRPIASATVAKELRTLVAMMNEAVNQDRIPNNPIKNKIKMPHEDFDGTPPHWFTKPELNLILELPLVTKRPDGAEFLRADYRKEYRFLANTGLRRAEFFQQDRKHIGRDEMKVLSLPNARTKSRKWREIPLGEGAQAALEQMPKTGRIAPPINCEALSRAFKRDLERVGLAGSLHSLRHTYCSHMVMAGHSLRTVQVCAGHSSAEVTERYSHLSKDFLRAAVVSL